MNSRLSGACLCAALCLSGCFNLRTELRTQKIEVSSTPPGAWIHQHDAQGRRFAGRAPLTVEKKYQVTTRRFRHWHWLWPVVFGGCMAAGGAIMTNEDVAGGGLLALCAPGFLTTLIVDIVGAVRSGGVVSSSQEPVQFAAHLDHHSRDERTVQVPGPEQQIAFQLRPVAAPEAGPTLVEPSRPPPSAPPAVMAPPVRGKKGKPVIVAVFDVEDAAGRFTGKVLDQLTDFLAAKLTEETGYRVVPRQQLRQRLVAEKKEGYKKCYDESCQIDLGKAVAAQKSLATKLLRVGETCAISSTLFDLKTETTEKATSIRTTCAEDSLMEGLETIARRLRRAGP